MNNTNRVNEMQKFVEKCQNQGELVKLNLGCGTDYKEGWINVDNNSDHNINRLDVLCDLSQGLPISDGCVDYIFNEHFLEHLSVEEAQFFLKECLRVLKPKGVLRIAMPDLENAIIRYVNFDIASDPLVTKYGMREIKTKAERINLVFRSWGHKWLYDGEELERRLKDAGFDNIVRCKLHNSTHSWLNNLESRDESALIMEAKRN